MNEFAALLRGVCDTQTATASPSTCRWSPSCRSRCWPAPGWASSIRRSSAGSAGQRAATALLTRRAAFWSRWTAITATGNSSTISRRLMRRWRPPGRLGHEIEKVLVWRRASRRVRLARPDGPRPRLLRRRPARRLPRPDRGTGVHASRGAAVPHVYEWHHRAAQGLPAQHRRVSRLRRRNLEVLPGHPPGRHLLVRRRWMDYRALVHRVRPPRPGHRRA